MDVIRQAITGRIRALVAAEPWIGCGGLVDRVRVTEVNGSQLKLRVQPDGQPPREFLVRISETFPPHR